MGGIGEERQHRGRWKYKREDKSFPKPKPTTRKTQKQEIDKGEGTP